MSTPSEMGTPEGGLFRHDTARVARMIGNGISRQVIRRWRHKGRIEGAIQEEKNAKVWLNDRGVLETWTLWADYQDLDFEVDMPPAVRKVQDKLGARPDAASKASNDERLTVTIILPPGAHLKVIQQG